MMFGLFRSSAVMDSTIASTCFMRFGSEFTCLSIFEFTPGSIFSRPSRGPSFCICFIADRKSWRSIPSFRTFFSSFFASAASNASCAFSTSETMSPIWRIRPAMRSG